MQVPVSLLLTFLFLHHVLHIHLSSLAALVILGWLGVRVWQLERAVHTMRISSELAHAEIVQLLQQRPSQHTLGEHTAHEAAASSPAPVVPTAGKGAQ